MARVIVIVGLMVAITAAMFALTRRSPVPPGEAATEASTTVRLAAPTGDDKIDDAASLTSVGPRPPASSTPPPSAQDVAARSIPGPSPSFGTAGVDDKGNASFTGTAAPGDAVTLLLNGKSLAATKADDKGSWSLAFKAPASESHLQVSAQGQDGSVVIGLDRAVIRPSSTPGGLPRVTLKTPDEAAPAPMESKAAPAEAKTGLIVEKVTGGTDGQATLTGRADAGATVKASINGKPAGETQVAADGVWTLAASNPLRKAAKGLRLELIDNGGAKLDQTNVPYEIAAAPKVVATESKSAAEFSSVLSSKPAKAKRKRQAIAALAEPGAAIEEPRQARIIKVRRGDSLWRISRRHLGNGKKWAAFYKANKAKIDNPDLIYPGQVLILPG